MNNFSTEFNRIAPYFSKKVLVSAHKNPDGDAVGSALALYFMVKALGGDPFLYSQDMYGDEFDYLGFRDIIHLNIPENESFDATIIADTGSENLLGSHIPSKEKSGKLIVIDHHNTRDPYGDIEIVDSFASATGIIVFELAEALNISITPQIAKSLWCAIFTDTGGFRYGSTDARTLRTSAKLIDYGAEPWEATKSIYESNPFDRVRLLGMALTTLKRSENQQVCGLYLSRKMLKESGIDSSLASGFVNYARSIKGVEIAFFVRPDKQNLGMYRVSFRSKGNLAVDSIAAKFGGGGHKNAAGCNVESDSASGAVQLIFDAVKEVKGTN